MTVNNFELGNTKKLKLTNCIYIWANNIPASHSAHGEKMGDQCILRNCLSRGHVETSYWARAEASRGGRRGLKEGRSRPRGPDRDMGQCVTKCKNPSSSLGSKSGEKEPGSKSQNRKNVGTGGSRGIGPKEESSAPCSKSSSEPIFNGTKASDMEVTVESTMTSVSTTMGEQRKEERPADGEGPFLHRIEELFRHYKDPQEDSILEEGMERFCNDLCVDPAEFRVLVLAWKFQAATMCKFTRKEFVDGCRALHADSLEGIFSRFPNMLLEAQGEESFKDLYRFTFQFGLDADEGQRSLQRDIAIALWRLVFTQDTPAILESWLDFLDDNPSGVRGISRDTWNMFLNFTQAIGPDLSNYSEDEAWPSLFDTFVEWEMEHRKKREQEELLKRTTEEEQGADEDRGCSKTDESLPSSTDRLKTEEGRGSQTMGDH
ncbi:hypothetical protein DPEC_G00360870 [Dallia pectoralis]|uniref:Uncharacterized protein n=1 Tax=Dallia pectoralis TaxID=75939 RepID=A0ACC2F0Z5_DALPE|nr:hypothetical protein DPEC_G00360870 [Dallia pectoralis]